VHRDPLQRRDAVDVDDKPGLRQAHVQDGHEALPTRQDAGVVAVFRQQAENLLEALRPDVFEPRSLHALSLPCDGNSIRNVAKFFGPRATAHFAPRCGWVNINVSGRRRRARQRCLFVVGMHPALLRRVE
jgi:hypothetical protein